MRMCATPTWAKPKRRAPVMADSILDVAEIETCYGLSQVLYGVSLTIAPGEMVTLMGRNGMGKTTTVRSIMGLTPARAGVSPMIERTVVVLPMPLRPISVTISPGAMVNDTPYSTWLRP